MRDATIQYRPIGTIRTPFQELAGMPIQAAAAGGAEGRIELDPDLAEGLEGLDGFSHLILLYHLDRVGDRPLMVTSFLADVPHGIFATRSPARPNPIGISTVRLVRIDGATIHVADVDMLDGTPLLDIKPYVPAMDDRVDVRIGWYEERIARLGITRSDERFGARSAAAGDPASED